MNSGNDSTFVGFGFGPIQAGLFLLEAQRSGNFKRLVLAEVVPELVEAVRASGGVFGLNVAYSDRIESFDVGPIEIYNPNDGADREQLIAAVAEATEIATAVPSVAFYQGESEGSLHRVLHDGIARQPEKLRVIYAAENHIAAAEALKKAILAVSSTDRLLDSTCIANTVIGKMSAVITDRDRIEREGLRSVVTGIDRAFLVESFRHILISKIEFSTAAAFQRDIEAFEEKSTLEPFEEAKLYGHNATHALAGYLAQARGLTRLEQLRETPECVSFLHAAFLEESGSALITKWQGADPLFTSDRFGAYVNDLIERMLNPFLGDLVERIARDPERKLGWNDRLIGVMRLALTHGLSPDRFALGAASALYALCPEILREPARTRQILTGLWHPDSIEPDSSNEIIDKIEAALPQLCDWVNGKPPATP